MRKCNPFKKLFYGFFLVLLSVSISGCEGQVLVYVQNNTTDNFRINETGKHITRGSMAFQCALSEDAPATDFELCRSYGCPAKVSIVALKFPERDPGNSNWWGDELARHVVVTFTEAPRNVFIATTKDKELVSIEVVNYEEPANEEFD
jgi:hypothetical protein